MARLFHCVYFLLVYCFVSHAENRFLQQLQKIGRKRAAKENAEVVQQVVDSGATDLDELQRKLDRAESESRRLRAEIDVRQSKEKLWGDERKRLIDVGVNMNEKTKKVRDKMKRLQAEVDEHSEREKKWAVEREELTNRALTLEEKLKEQAKNATEKERNWKEERKKLINLAMIHDRKVADRMRELDASYCREEIERRDKLIGDLEQGNCKALASQINKVEHEIELKWQPDSSEITVLHKVNLEEAERKLEMLRTGANDRLRKKEDEQREKELDELRAHHQEELERVLGEVDAAADKVLKWQYERKKIVSLAIRCNPSTFFLFCCGRCETHQTVYPLLVHVL